MGKRKCAEQVADCEGDVWRRFEGDEEFELMVVGTRMTKEKLEHEYGPLTEADSFPGLAA
jgi:hypothetical protein